MTNSIQTQTGPVAGPEVAGTITTTFQVSGMTCMHCSMTVEDEVRKLPWVRAAHVDLSNGQLTVTSEYAVDHQGIKEAVVNAGYELLS